MRIRIRGPIGEFPRIASRFLLPNAAQTAENSDLRHTDLRAFAALLQVWDPAKAGTVRGIYRFGDVVAKDAFGLITAATTADPVVITSASHGLVTGDKVHIHSVVGMEEINDLDFTVTVIDADRFSLGVDGTAYTAYTSGGVWVKHNGYWFHWVNSEAPDGVSVARGAIDGDTAERTYWTGHGAPKMSYSPLAVTGGTSYPIAARTLGIPAPTAPPAAAVKNRTGAITAATKANPVVITSNGHGLKTGFRVKISGVGGMTQLNDREFTIKAVNSNRFSLDGEDGTAHSTYTTGGTWELVNGNETSHSWVYTYVSDLGEEGPPSPPSSTLDVQEGETVDLTELDISGPAGGTYGITKKRIYRFVSDGAGGGSYFFVAEVNLNVASYEDTMGDFQEALESAEWDPPPAGLKGLIVLPNGVMAGFTANTLYLSVPYQPHAWPTTWTQTTESDIVGIANYGNTIVVGTQTRPYIVYGTHPSSMTMRKILVEHACLSRRGMVSMGEAGVAYPAPEGLIRVQSEAAPEVVTKDLLTEKDWQALKPSSIHAYFWQGLYIGFYDAGTDKGGFIFDPLRPDLGLTFLDFHATAGYTDPKSGELYLAVNGKIMLWNPTGAPAGKLRYTWRSRRFVLERPRALTACQILGQSAYTDLLCKIYGDGQLIHTEVVTDDHPFRTEDSDHHRTFEIEFIGTDTVEEVALAESVGLLADL